MSAVVSPVDARAYILERLVGETGEPDKIGAAGAKLVASSAEGMAENVNPLLAFPLDYEPARVELGRMADALTGLGETGAAAVVASAASPDSLVLALDGAAVSLVVSAFLGGDSDFPTAPLDRPLSDIELDIVNAVFEAVARAVDGEAARFGFLLPPPPTFTGGDIAKHVLRDGPAAKLPITLRSRASSGTLVLTIPQRVLMSTAEHDRPGAGTAAEPGAAWSERLGDEVRRSAVTVEALVPVTPMSLGAISALKVGQVLELAEGARSATRLAARGKTLFICEFGKIGPNYSVRVRQPAGDDRQEVEALALGF